MAAPLVKTKHPGIYKRGTRYVVSFRDEMGRQRRESARTIDEARRLKAKRSTQVSEGNYREQSRLTFAEYAREWIEGYQGKRSGRGFRKRTRDDYRRDLERYAIPKLGSKRVTAIRRSHVKELIAWLVDDDEQKRRHEQENAARKAANGERIASGEKPLPPIQKPGPLRDRTVERIVSVVSACFTSAVDDELRPDNPASQAILPGRDPVPMPGEGDEVEHDVKALTRAELRDVLLIMDSAWRVFFRLLGATGLRIGEAVALDVRHLRLDGSHPHVKVRRAYGRDGMNRPKSRHGVRDVPLPRPLVDELRRHVAGLPEFPPAVVEKWGQLAFPSTTGTPMMQENLRRRYLEPATALAEVSWAGFHAFRHAFASMHIERGTNIVRLSRLLGHHKPSFTLDVYGHLLDEGMGDPLDLDGELEGGNKVVTDPSRNGSTPTDSALDVSAPESENADSAGLDRSVGSRS